LICYYRFGLVSIIIANEYYFFGGIDIQVEPLPNGTREAPTSLASSKAALFRAFLLSLSGVCCAHSK